MSVCLVSYVYANQSIPIKMLCAGYIIANICMLIPSNNVLYMLHVANLSIETV